jgi:hypothetical protein
MSVRARALINAHKAASSVRLKPRLGRAQAAECERAYGLSNRGNDPAKPLPLKLLRCRALQMDEVAEPSPKCIVDTCDIPGIDDAHARGVDAISAERRTKESKRLKKMVDKNGASFEV